MGRYRGPKNKLARREEVDLELKTPGSSAQAALLRRLNIPPGIQPSKKRKKVSDYVLQLREKQKVKRIYGLLEKQFKKYFLTASKKKTAIGTELLKLLEKRLDNVVYRLGFSPTRSAARQLIAHGHVLVNDKKVTIPSYQTDKGVIITLKEKSFKIPAVKKMLAEKKPLPSWLVKKGPVGKVIAAPKREDIRADIDEQLIIAFYSR